MGSIVGYWKVGDEIFAYKSMALIRATELRANITYHFYDEIWDSFDRSVLGKVPLKALYRERAQQLRDSYDYLILYYSGGADSRNILRTFLENKIKLDCVFVKWPISAVGKGIYPLTTDRSSLNFMCEWDFVIKPDLQWLRSTHPEITIEVADYMDGINQSMFTDQAFDNLHQFTYMSNILRIPFSSKIEKRMAESGKKVAGIYGVDKPVIGALPNGRCHMVFLDTATTVNPTRPFNPNGTEYFYWTPDMPIIAFEQAYQIISWFRARPRYQHLIRAITHYEDLREKTEDQIWDRFHKQQEIYKSIIYPNYDRTIYQAEKPLRGLGEFIGVSKDYHLETHPEIKPIKGVWDYHWKSWMQQISPDFYGKTGFFNQLRTKGFYVDTI